METPEVRSDFRPRRGLRRLTVSGFKSILNEQSIEIAPLTVLSGSNSAGKSSMMQALLLLKQTLDSPYDPGPLLLNGPHVKCTHAKQVFSRTGPASAVAEMSIGLELEGGAQLTTRFRSDADNRKIQLAEMTYQPRRGNPTTLRADMATEEMTTLLPDGLVQAGGETTVSPELRRRGCFYWLSVRFEGKSFTFETSPAEPFAEQLRQLIHLPGLRGNPERSYPVSGVSGSFPGTFQSYAASVVAKWQADRNNLPLKAIGEDLAYLGLGFGLKSEEANETEIRLQVGRVRSDDVSDAVNIADVGLGVSQTLPILLALQVAGRGQVVFIEEPEIHLHPRAQVRLTELLVREARRGVKIVIETHSPLILVGIQTAIAKGFPREDVALYWFTRSDETGVTSIAKATLDEAGRFGDWPVDFADISLSAQEDYFEAGAGRE